MLRQFLLTDYPFLTCYKYSVNVLGVFHRHEKVHDTWVEKEIVTGIEYITRRTSGQVRNQSQMSNKDQANEWLWGPGPVLKRRFYYYLGMARSTNKETTVIKKIIIIQCYSQYSCVTHAREEGTCHTTQGHRGNQQDQSRDKGINLENKQSVRLVSNSALLQRPRLENTDYSEQTHPHS